MVVGIGCALCLAHNNCSMFEYNDTGCKDDDNNDGN